MTMTDLALWSQVLSAVAVLGTLVYLAIEIGQNTAAARASTRLSAETAAITELHKLIEFPDALLDQAKAGPLTPQEAIRSHAFLAATFRRTEYAWLQHKGRLADNYLWENERQVIRLILCTKRNQIWWRDIGRHGHASAFVAEVDSLLNDLPDMPYFDSILDWGAAPA